MFLPLTVWLCSVWRLLNLVSPASYLWCVGRGTCLLESLGAMRQKCKVPAQTPGAHCPQRHTAAGLAVSSALTGESEGPRALLAPGRTVSPKAQGLTPAVLFADHCKSCSLFTLLCMEQKDTQVTAHLDARPRSSTSWHHSRHLPKQVGMSATPSGRN